VDLSKVTIAHSADSNKARTEQSNSPSDTMVINLVLGMPVPMIITRKSDGEILFANQLFASVFSIEYDKLAGLKVADYYSGINDRAKLKKSIDSTGYLKDFEISCKKQDGTSVKMMAYIQAIKFKNQESLLCTFYDIRYNGGHFYNTNKSEDLFTSVVNNIGIGVAVISPKMEILTLNKQMRNWNPDIDLKTKPICYKAFNNPPKDSICRYCPTAKTLVDGVIHESITETTSVNGIRNYRIVSSPIRNIDGEVICAIEMVEDVTERLVIEKDLQNSEKKIRALLDQTFQFIALLLPDGTLIDVNESALEFSGIKKSDVSGKPFWEGPWWTHSVKLQEKLKAAINDAAQGQFIRFEVTHPDKTGNLHYVDFSLKPIIGDNGRVIYLIPEGRDITESKSAEKALRNTQLMLQLVMDSIPQRIFWKDSELYYLGCNQNAARDAGLASPEMIVGKTDYDLSWKAKAEHYRADDLQVMKSGIPKISFEEKITYPDGSELWVQTNKVPLHDQEGKIVGLLGTYDDITERKMAEQKILLDNRRMDALLALYRYSDSSMEEFSAALVENAILMTQSKIGYLGLLNEDESVITMQYWSKTAHSACNVVDKPIVYKVKDTGLWGEAVRQRKPVITNDYAAPNQQKRGIPDGHVPIVRHVNIPVFDGEKIVAVIGMGNKATDYDEIDVRQLQLLMESWLQVVIRKNTELALIESQEMQEQLVNRYTAMINTVPAIIYIKDLEGKYVVVNRAFVDFVGIPQEQIIGLVDNQIFPPEKAVSFNEADKKVIETNKLVTVAEEQVQDVKGIMRWVATTKVPLHDAQGRVSGIVGLTQDVSEFHNSRQQLIQSDKLAAIGTLAAGVAHEINNPIGYVNSNLNTMNKYLNKIAQYIDNVNINGDTAKIKEILSDFEDAIKESIEGSARVRKIVADLKTFSRVDQADKVFADINEGIRSTLNIVWNELKYKCKVEQNLGELPDYYCIPNQLNQVFLNLLVNAGQAITSDNGLIKIKTWADSLNIYINIADSGCGISQDNIKKIFEPFFTTKEVGKGTGLGLSLTYDIIKKHNGKIDVKSQVGVGTEFTITLPIEGVNE
jgi:PAS domain S-box-containing protein